MLGNVFSIEKKNAPQQKGKLTPLEERLLRQNEKLKREIDGLYGLLMDKEISILKLKKFISEELHKPENIEDSPLLEEQLTELLLDEDNYDPRIVLQKIDDEKSSPEVASASQANQTSTPSNVQDTLNPADTTNSFQSEDIKSPSSPNISAQNQSFESTESGSFGSPNLSPKKPARQSLLKRKEDKKKNRIKPIESETITRNLFSFELELKEYSAPTFEAVKQFIARNNLSVEEIHDEIERLAEFSARQKYFTVIFPNDTQDQIADELENYIFEILHPKLFLIDEDIKGYALQFRDRINVLKNLVTFEVLELPEALRNHDLFTFAIKEFQKMSTFKAPIWKLRAFQNAVNYIINVYNEHVHRDPCSDELFPVLVYIVLHSNVDLLRFNVDYIYKHLRKAHLLGQFGFLIINLKAIIQFLQDLDGNSLAAGKLQMLRR